jgi:hypothetical protein
MWSRCKLQHGQERFDALAQHRGRDIGNRIVPPESFDLPKLELATHETYSVIRRVHAGLITWYADARVKIKSAAYLYPIFRFVAVTKEKKREGGGWRREEF